MCLFQRSYGQPGSTLGSSGVLGMADMCENPVYQEGLSPTENTVEDFRVFPKLEKAVLEACRLLFG